MEGIRLDEDTASKAAAGNTVRGSSPRLSAKHGEVVEWLKTAVLKTAGCNSPVGSNPTFSAKQMEGCPSGKGPDC